VIPTIEREGQFAPLLNKAQLHEDMFGGREIALSIFALDTKWMKTLILKFLVPSFISIRVTMQMKILQLFFNG
jgi:hypothetical protein